MKYIFEYVHPKFEINNVQCSYSFAHSTHVYTLPTLLDGPERTTQKVNHSVSFHARIRKGTERQVFGYSLHLQYSLVVIDSKLTVHRSLNFLNGLLKHTSVDPNA